MTMIARIAAGVLVAGAATGAQASVSLVDYFTLTGTELVDFDDLPNAGGGVNYDSIVVSNGVGFGERFAGQTTSFSGTFDVLNGSPTGPLTVVAGAANQNVSLLFNSGSNVITGLGPLGFPSADAIGEGALSLLFSSDQSQFGFQLLGGNNGAATVSFYTAGGGLVDSIVIDNLAGNYYGFSRDGGIKDIRGISIVNSDPAGIGLDNLKFDVRSAIGGVPEPTSWAMLIAGFGLVGASARRRRHLSATAG